MVGVNALGQPGWQAAAPLDVFRVPIGNRMAGYVPYPPFQGFKAPQPDSDASATPTYRQWPWRGFAFASDLGLVGYLIKQPVLGSIGWLVALPYYAYALLQQKDARGRKQEGLYQATANGIFPFLEAKLGVAVGGFVSRKLPDRLTKKYPTSGLHRLPRAMYKGIGGLLALLVLTPVLGDPLSRWLTAKASSSMTSSVKGEKA